MPTLHEYNIICLKLRVNPSYAMELPIRLCEPLSGDFDGDQLAIHLIPEDIAEDTFQKMSPRYVHLYKKNLQPIYVPNHETLNGLAVATGVDYDDPDELKEPKLLYTSYTDLLKDVEVNKKISLSRVVLFTGKVGEIEYKNKITTLGKLRLSKIVNADIDLIPGVIDPPMTKMTSKGAAKLVLYMQQFPEYVERLNELQKYALMVVTRKGVVTFDFDTLYADTDNDTYREIKDIADNPKLTDKQKLLMMNEKYKEYLVTVKDSLNEDIKRDVKDANRVKVDSIVAMVAPALIVSGVDEKPIITRSTLIDGFTEKDFQVHAIENRSLQSIKVMGVPSSGYLTRQISFLMNDYIYKVGSDPDNKCILLPRYRTEGRTSINGKIYPKFNGKPDESDLVLVRSIITKANDTSVVTSDLISNLYTDIEDGSPIGSSFSTSLTQALTQSALSLKHGGHERVIDETGYLRAPKNCRVREQGRFLFLESGSEEFMYPRPVNIVLNDKPKFKKGELIGTAYRTTSPIYKLNALIKLMRARGSDGTRYFEKDNVIISDCYALDSGTIHYVPDKNGDITVRIGSRNYDYNPESMYYYPDGYEVKKFQRICSGVVNMGRVIQELGTDLQSVYLIFRKQFYELISSDFSKGNPLGGGDMREELVEMAFIALSNVKQDEHDVEKIDFLGTYSGVQNNDSFYTLLSYGYSGRVVNKALNGEVELKGDVMSETILGLLLNNSLDD